MARLVGAWTAGRRAGDEIVRERTKLMSTWARWGLAGMMAAAWIYASNARERAYEQERQADRMERAARDQRLASTFDKLSESIDRLGMTMADEREACLGLRAEVTRAYGVRLNTLTAPPQRRK